MRRMLFLVVGLLLLSPLAHAQEGSISIGLAEAPTNRADDPRAKVYIVDHVKPGTTISRRVKVTNSTDATQSIETYAAAASVRNGEFRFGDGRAVNELTTWTKVETPADAYAPGEEKLLAVTIKVPDNASEGERYAVIWASVASAESGNAISAVNRVGVRVYLSVGPGGEPPSDFEITGMRAKRTAAGDPLIAATVKNTGGRALDLSGTLQLSDGPGGLSAGPFQVKVGTTLGVGQSGPVEVTLDKALPAGPWEAKLELESGLTKRDASATVTFPKSGAGPTVKPGGGDDGGVGSLGLIAAGVVVVGAAATALFLGLRRRGVA
ncbi:MAG TPA: hypothetical protein VMZ22_04160 [Acidimicrobiales bacterium]|nr:hypothetical protein [Acidimicrobiales bacterium]